MTETFSNYIGGEWVEGDGEFIEVRNPAHLSQVTGRFPRSSEDEVSRAVTAAAEAFEGWSQVPAPRRADILRGALENMKSRREDLARVLTRENGKPLEESRGEIDYAINDMEFQIGEGARLCGQTVPVSMSGVQAYSFRQPVGVVGLITPWNFPFNVPAGKCTSALVAGCTAVFKPASLTPQVGLRFVELFIDAGLPEGVLNFVTGSGREVGDALVSDPRVKAISFTGSTEVGRHIQRVAAENFTRTQLEMGGKNPVVILDDADLDCAVEDTVSAAFGTSGQKCTATSRAIVTKGVAERFTELLLERVQQIKVGDGMDPDTDMGPVCGETQMENVLACIEKGREEGADLLTGGHRLTGGDYDDGCFIAPTVFGGVRHGMEIAREEIFGPVLTILQVQDFDEALEVANGVRYGLSSSIYTADLEKAHTFVERAEVGVTHVNLMTALNEPQLPFHGVKESGFGIPEAGKKGVEFYTEEKIAYLKYR